MGRVTGFPLTVGDKKVVGGRDFWKSRISDALGCLCENCVIYRLGPSSSNYTIIKPSATLCPV